MKFALTLGKGLLWICALVLGLALIAYISLLIINWHDEAPQAAAIELEGIYAARPVPTDEDNAYVYLMGYSALPDQSPIEVGLKRIASQREALQQPWTEAFGETEPDALSDTEQKLPSKFKVLLDMCAEANEACADSLLANEQHLSGWLKDQRLPLERYLGLIQRTAMHEPLPFDIRSKLPPYQRVFQGQRLSFTSIWLVARQGDIALVQKRLDDDLRFWRMTLANADTLIVKMLAARAIKQHFLWANLALNQLPTEQLKYAIPPSWEQALSQQERSFLHTFSGEMAFIDRMLQQMKNGELDWYNSLEIFTSGNSESSAVIILNRLGRPFLQPQALANLNAVFLLDLEKTFAVPYEQLPIALERAKRVQEARLPKSHSISLLYNLAGNLMRWQEPDYDFTDYFLRIADLEGIRRSSLLAATLHSQNIAPEDVQNYLDDTDLNTPVSGAPFDWDIDAGTLTFTGMSQNGITRIQYVTRR